MTDSRQRGLPAGWPPFAAVAAGILLVLLWARRLEPVPLIAGGSLFLVSIALWFRVRRRVGGAWLAAALIPLGLAAIAGLRGSQVFRRIEHEWDAVQAERDRELTDRLDNLMATLTARGREAAARAAEAAQSAGPVLFSRLEDVRDRMQVDAIAVFSAGGSLTAWAGEHRGPIPDAVRQGTRSVYFVEQPLYSYLYFAVPIDSDDLHHVVAAVLVETSPIVRPRQGGTTTTFAARTNVPAVFRSGPGNDGRVAWSLVEAGDTVVHARLDPATPADVRAEVELRSQRIVVALALLALILASIGWLVQPDARGAEVASMAPLLVMAFGFAVAPMGAVLGIRGNATSLAFLLPLPGISLGDVVALLIAAGAIAATLRSYRPPERTWSAYFIAAAVLVGLIYTAVLRSFIGMATPSLLEGGRTLWIGMQTVATLVLTLTTALVLPSRRDATGSRTFPILAALFIAALLAIVVQAFAYANRAPVPFLALLWVGPLLLFGLGAAGSRGAAQRIGRWAAAGFIAATAVLPQLWGAATDARLQTAEHELRSFGTQPPAIIEYQLEQFAAIARQRYEAGEMGAQLLYRSWVASGLAQEPYPVRITLWPDGRIPIELGLGGAEGQDADSAAIRDRVAMGAPLDSPAIHHMPGVSNATVLLTARMDANVMLSVSVQPRKSLQRIGIIEPFLGAAPESDADVTLLPATDVYTGPDSIRWTPSPNGWRSDYRTWYPDGEKHAHMEVRFIPPLMRIVRGGLLITLDVTALLVLFALGHVARGLRVMRPGVFRSRVTSFQARVTFALFAFFLVPTIAFGWLAYRGLSTVVTEAAGAVAARTVRQAVVEWGQDDGNLRELSERTGADVLYYLRGELANTSSVEGRQLGVYGAWMGPVAYRLLVGGEEATAREITQLEGRSYLTAYEVLRPSGMLAVPIPLFVGDTASRQRDIAEITLLAAVLGLLLSGVLSVAVGRTLAGPIGQLRRAATAVGAGRLSIRLPEPASGEFGQLFSSFNRMTRRLRRARAQEVRTARVLAWGEMAQQIAHEIKNPLTPIKLAVQHLRRAFRDGQKDFGRILDDNVEQILTEINRLTDISRAFSRYGAPVPEAGPLSDVNVSAVVHEAITLYRAGDSKVNYDENVEADVLLARARIVELREVLMNLLENARDAVGAEGSVTVAARRVDGRVEMEVTDDGPGIPAELMPRIFDPHFSTRSSGTGLGLAIVKRLVESWGGRVEVESRQEHGTRFSVSMPAAGEE